MATWGNILEQLKKQAEQTGRADFDQIRLNALRELAKYTKRNTILYASGHLQKPQGGQALSITDDDLEGFMEVIFGMNGDRLDLVLHSPGGVPEAAESIVQYLKSKFKDIRVIVPQMAMSAATMISCAAHEIVMARHSKLGPIDPQLVMQTDAGVRLVAAWAVLDQFELAKRECVDQQTLAVWYPILRQYGPALLTQCTNAITYSQTIVSDWLAAGMFAGDPDGAKKAKVAGEKLADREHLTHGRPLARDYLRKELGLKIRDLEDDQKLQDRVLTVYHAYMHTFSSTNAVKLIESSSGQRFVKLGRPVTIAELQQPQQQAKPKKEPWWKRGKKPVAAVE